MSSGMHVACSSHGSHFFQKHWHCNRASGCAGEGSMRWWLSVQTPALGFRVWVSTPARRSSRLTLNLELFVSDNSPAKKRGECSATVTIIGHKIQSWLWDWVGFVPECTSAWLCHLRTVTSAFRVFLPLWNAVCSKCFSRKIQMFECLSEGEIVKNWHYLWW